MASSRWAALAALNLFCAVALGAFGAHALRARLDAPLLAIWHTGVSYHQLHGLGLFAVGWLLSRSDCRLLRSAAWAMQLGIVLFCGSLYLLAWTGTRWLGAITPLGGVAFLVAWLLVALGAWRLGEGR